MTAQVAYLPLPGKVPAGNSEKTRAKVAATVVSTEPELDADVLRRLRAGDPDALGAVYDRFSKPVWTVAMSILHDRELAEDAMNEAFMRLWKSAAGYDASRPLAPFLFTIARRSALDLYRREHRPTRGDHEPERDDVVVNLPDLEQAWEAWEIQGALEELPKDERAILQLSHFLQMTHAEIAEKLEVPVGTVKSRSHRAHKRLASRLRHLLPQGETTSRRGGDRNV